MTKIKKEAGIGLFLKSIIFLFQASSLCVFKDSVV